mgnify:CR=1 FL=1
MGNICAGRVAIVTGAGRGIGREHALMLVLTAGLPTALGTLGLAAVLSAEISSADAVLFMVATSLWLKPL